MIVEIASFRLADGAAEAAFLAADKAVQAELSADHAGLIRRTTGRNDDGEWVVVTLWGTIEDAEASAARKAEPTLRDFWALTEMVRINRYEDLGG